MRRALEDRSQTVDRNCAWVEVGMVSLVQQLYALAPATLPPTKPICKRYWVIANSRLLPRGFLHGHLHVLARQMQPQRAPSLEGLALYSLERDEKGASLAGRRLAMFGQ